MLPSNIYIIYIFGLTKDPITKEYIFVMEYMENGSLQNYLTKDFKNLKWKQKIDILYFIKILLIVVFVIKYFICFLVQKLYKVP